MKALVAYDGSINSKTALKRAIKKVNDSGGELLVLHVFDNSIFIDYDAGPGAEKMARIESARHVEEARRILERAGDVRSRIIVEEGNPADEIIRLAKTESVDIIFTPPKYKSVVKSAPCPVSILPGSILVPLDNTDVPTATIERITEESTSTGSKVILLGIVPIHIYGTWEKSELDKVKRETSALMNRIKKDLNERKVETREIIRFGYPDEEILKAAEENPLFMIIMPAGGDEPSELSKAAVILSDKESGVANKPLVLMRSTT